MATLPWIMNLILMMLFITLERKNGVEASHRIIPQLQSLNATSATQFYRTGYHFQPPQNWINDPNGLMYYKGIYHLFYQYNTKGVVWGNIVWGHSVSTDLINWFPLEPAISPDQTFDCRGTWSGSVTFLPGNKPTIMYTGLDSKERQMQNIAEPKDLSDPFLREWIKPTYNPIIEPENGINSSSFRDPTTAWLGKDGLWRTIVGNKRGDRGVVLLFKSRDFIRWTKTQQPLHSAPNTGMWECPDFFPVSLKEKQGLDTSANDGVKHVLKVSLDNTRTEYYTVGQYNENTDRYLPDNTSADNSSGLRFDYGNFYGSKTFFDESTDRRILFGWANESDTVSDDILKGWAGIQTIPRTVLLDKTGRQLVQWPVEEIKTLRGNKVELNKMDMKNGSHFEVKGLNSAQADVEVIFELPSLKKAESFDPSWVDPQKLCGEKDSSVQGGVGPFGLLTLASKNLEEYTPVFFRVFKAKDKHVVLMCSGGDRSSLKPDLYKPLYGGFVDVDLSSGMISLRSLIDNSVVESFGAEGKVVITSRIYPLLAIGQEAHLHMFNNGTETIKVSKLKAWTMKKPFMN